MAKGSKYTEAHVAAIQAAAEQGPIDLTVCKELAETPLFRDAEITARGIVAKVRTMNLEYQPVERKSKDGRKVVRKDELVEQLEEITGLTGLDALEKGGKQALRKVVDWAREMASEDA